MKILDFNLENYEALIFDLDGTLINSMPIHNRAWMETLHGHGAEITQQFLNDTAGMSSSRIVTIVNHFLKNIEAFWWTFVGDRWESPG